MSDDLLAMPGQFQFLLDFDELLMRIVDPAGVSIAAVPLVIPEGEVLGIFTVDGIMATENDIEVATSGKGLILTSPDGTRWRVTVDNLGTATWAEVE